MKWDIYLECGINEVAAVYNPEFEYLLFKNSKADENRSDFIGLLNALP